MRFRVVSSAVMPLLAGLALLPWDTHYQLRLTIPDPAPAADHRLGYSEEVPLGASHSLSPSETHTLTVTANAPAPSTVASGGTASLSAGYTDAGHSIATWAWSDGGAGGSFSNASVENPTYTAAANTTGSDRTVTLTVTGTCDGPSPLSDTDSTTLTVQPVEYAFTVEAGATPYIVPSGGTSTLWFMADPHHWMQVTSWYWDDGGAGGTFSPSPWDSPPTYTAPVNAGANMLAITLTVTVNCSGGDSASGSVILFVQPASHTVTVFASATPNPVDSEETTALSASGFCSQGHSLVTWAWDHEAGIADLGSFSDAFAQNPTYTAPANLAISQSLIALTVTATCDGDIPISGCAVIPLEVNPAEHTLSVTAGADPTRVSSGGSTSLSATLTQSLLSHGAASWSWDDGGAGGTFSDASVQNPTYTAPQNHTGGDVVVALTATATCGGCLASDHDTVSLTVAPLAFATNFSGNPTSGTAPLTTAFTDLSTGTPTSWSWNFGDSSTSPSQHPSHTYTSAGIYTVSLRATNASGYDDEVKLNYITVQAPGAVPTFVAAGQVTSSTGAITPTLPAGIASGDILLLFLETANQAISISNPNGGTWAAVTNSPQGTGSTGTTSATRLTVFWSRYNGTQGPPTTTDSGNHQAGRIIAIRGCVTSGDPWDVTAGGVESTADTSGAIPGATTTVANTLVVAAIATALPDANGTANFSAWANSDLTSVTARTNDTRNTGNGGGLAVATGGKETPGTYANTAVTCGASTTKGMMSIALKPAPGSGSPPLAAFSAPSTRGNLPLAGSFTDLSTGTPTSWSWSFGDGSSSTAQNPTHSYAAAGTYTVSLTVANEIGSHTETKPGYVTVSFVDIAITPVAATDYWALNHILACVNAGIVGGYGDGTYRPSLPVTRDAMAVFISRALAGSDAHVPTGPPLATFPDVPTGYWAFKYVEYAVDNGVVGGYLDGTYRPTLTVTRDAMAVFVARAMCGGDAYVPTGPPTAYFPDVPTDFWAFRYVEYIKSEGVTGGYPDGTYRPTGAVTRDQMAVYVQRAFELPM